jgi:hypothetical protein
MLTYNEKRAAAGGFKTPAGGFKAQVVGGFNTQVVGDKTGLRLTDSSFQLLETFDNIQIGKIGVMLKKMGYSVPRSAEGIKNLFLTNAMVLGAMTKGINSFPALMSRLQADYIPGLDSKEPNLPARTIAQQNPDVLKKLISDTYISAKGEKPNDATVDKVLKQWQNSINQGTLVTTSKVKNAKTGKLENVTKSTSGFSQAGAVAGLEKQIEKENPEEVERRKAFEFSDAFNKVMSGGI